MNKSIYDLKLHESTATESGNIGITRVAGGWLYKFWNFQKDDYFENTTFVPFNNEFQFCWKYVGRNVICGQKLPCDKHGN